MAHRSRVEDEENQSPLLETAIALARLSLVLRPFQQEEVINRLLCIDRKQPSQAIQTLSENEEQNEQRRIETSNQRRKKTPDNLETVEHDHLCRAPFRQHAVCLSFDDSHLRILHVL